jgi:large subunit ribosomal protein L13
MQRVTHTIDASGKILGRLSTEVSVLLRGKNKPGFVLNIDMGDSVVIYNSDKIRVTGKKASQKTYYTHSGHPGALKEVKLEKMLQTDSAEVIRLAVKNMLPNNKLRPLWLRRLEIRKGALDAD